MSERKPETLGWWRHQCRWYQSKFGWAVADLREARTALKQAYKDYDQVEAELRAHLASCTCRKESS